MIGQVGRREEPRTLLDGGIRIGAIGAVNPGADQPVWMIEAQSVKLAEHFAEAPGDEVKHRAGAAISREILRRVEHLIAPGLAFAVGAARWRAHEVVLPQQVLATPQVVLRKPHLHVAINLQAERLHASAEGAVLA